jgi:hypothetical protein
VLIAPAADASGAEDELLRAESAGGVAFLRRLVEMSGFRAVELGAAEAALLSAWPDSQYTGISIVLGAGIEQLVFGAGVDWCSLRAGCRLAVTGLMRSWRSSCVCMCGMRTVQRIWTRRG